MRAVPLSRQLLRPRGAAQKPSPLAMRVLGGNAGPRSHVATGVLEGVLDRLLRTRKPLPPPMDKGYCVFGGGRSFAVRSGLAVLGLIARRWA
jgi:hypothetical protein